MVDAKLAAQVVLIFSSIIGLLCVYGIIFPKQLIGWISDFWHKNMGFYLAIIVRLLFGLALIFAASETTQESIFTFLGYITILAAVMIAILGRTKVGMVILWAKTWPLLRVRAWLFFGLAFAAFLINSTL